MKRYEAIYLVDDYEMVNFLHRILLEKLGYKDNINIFTNPRKALEDLSSMEGHMQPTLILLDINMPEMSGFEFLEQMVREGFPQNMDVVIVTSSISETDRAAAQKYPGFVKGFIIKPLKIDQLRTLVEPVDRAV